MMKGWGRSMLEKVDTYAANECQVIDVMSIKEEKEEVIRGHQ